MNAYPRLEGAITSSPLVLSFDLSNSTKLDLVWDFITNKDALAVNSDWAGEAGRLVDTVSTLLPPAAVSCFLVRCRLRSLHLFCLYGRLKKFKREGLAP